MFDVIVIGIGGHGSSSIYHLAKSGLNVLGIEQFEQIHENGSSHGLSRIISLTTRVHTAYVPLIRRSFELWRELEKEYNNQILYMTGCIYIGSQDSPIFKDCVKIAIEHNLEHKIMDASEIMNNFPGFNLPSNFYGIFTKEGGFIIPEESIKAHTNLALNYGATINYNEKVLSWTDKESYIEVISDKNIYQCKKLVITAGAWNSEMFNIPNSLLSVQRQVVGWFPSDDKNIFKKENFPVWILDGGINEGYGFPEYGFDGLKIGIFNDSNENVDPDTYSKNINSEDIKLLTEFTKFFSKTNKGTNFNTCLFTNTPDGHWILDKHPDSKNCIIVSCCSGHGFKFAPIIGEIVTELCQNGSSNYNTELFKISRFK